MGPLRGPGVQKMRPEGAKGRGSAAGCVEGLCSLRSGGDGPSGRG